MVSGLLNVANRGNQGLRLQTRLRPMTMYRKLFAEFVFLVGARGFEPPTTATPLRCATRLRYAPNVGNCKALRP